MRVKKLPRPRKRERQMSVLVVTIDSPGPGLGEFEMSMLAFVATKRYGPKYVHGELLEAVEKRLDRGFIPEKRRRGI